MASKLSRVGPVWRAPDWASAPRITAAEFREALSDGYDEIFGKAKIILAVIGYKNRYKVDNLTSDLVQVTPRGGRSRKVDVELICPYTGEPCSTLYFVQGRAVSREAFGREEVRAEFRDRFISSLPTPQQVAARRMVEDGSERADRTAARQAMLKARDERRKQRQDRAKRLAAKQRDKLQGDLLGTWAVLRRAAAMDAKSLARCVAGLSFVPDPGVRAVVASGGLEAPRAVLEDHLHIDLRVLRKEPAFWAEGQVKLCRLAEGVLMAIDLRRAPGPHIRFAFMADGQPVLQILDLRLEAVGGRMRPMFLCPVAGPVEVVVLRGGRFAGAQAQRVLHRSQFGRTRTPKPRDAADHVGGS